MTHICCNQGVFKKLQFPKFLILQLLLKASFSALKRKLSNFTAAFNITLYHYSVKTSQKDCSQGYPQKDLQFSKFRVLQLLLESLLAAVSKGFDNLTATQNITWNHYNFKVSKKDCSQGYLQKNFYFAKFCILQLPLDPWFSGFSRELGNFIAAFSITWYH